MLLCYQRVFIFFFFQAEDGIRDVAVTGVQTCALPILALDAEQLVLLTRMVRLLSGIKPIELAVIFGDELLHQIRVHQMRSEERRVGKECRSGWWRYYVKKKEGNIAGMREYEKSVREVS